MSMLSLRLRALLPWERFAPHQLGAMYATGEGAPKSLEEASRWYRVGARRGDPESQYDLGFMYLLGEHFPADSSQALHWLRLAGEAGHRPAASLLAELYRVGSHGVTPDQAEARRWAQSAEEASQHGA